MRTSHYENPSPVIKRFEHRATGLRFNAHVAQRHAIWNSTREGVRNGNGRFRALSSATSAQFCGRLREAPFAVRCDTCGLAGSFFFQASEGVLQFLWRMPVLFSSRLSFVTL